MERGKGSAGRGKAKNQHFPSDLYVLGAKCGGGDTAKRPIPSGSGERKREGPPSTSLPLIPGKKAKTGVGPPSALGRLNPSSPTPPAGIEAWEAQAIDVEPAELVHSVLDCCEAKQLEKAGMMICGGLKTLKNTKWKPDSVLTMGLICLAKLRPSLFATDNVTQALSVLLKRDPQHNFKSKGNPLVAVLSANLLSRGYADTKQWPTSFIKLYVEDAMAERVWVDQPECKGFVSNILTGFQTKLPPANINLLVPEMGPLGIARAESPLTITLDDDDEGGGSNNTFDLPVYPRFTRSQDIVEQLVHDSQTNRRQTPESVTRNYLKLLASTAGMVDTRALAAPRLELWLQNPKLMKPAQELLLSICVNCCTHSQKDIQVIGALVKIRLKTKALITFYLACIRELISAHRDNLSTLLKHVIYNELSQSRNPNNMSIIPVIFQSQPELSATLLAEVFLELLMKPEDFLRPLRLLLREIIRALRHDINMLAFCRGLMVDMRDKPLFRDFDMKERMFCAIVDLLAHACLLGVSPAVKESVNLVARGDKREIHTLEAFHAMVATIIQETVCWLKDTALKVYRPINADFHHAVHKVVFMAQSEAYYKVDNWPPESERALVLRLVAECPLYETTLYNVLLIGLSKDHPLIGPDALELADQLVKRSAAISSESVSMVQANRIELVELSLKVATYHHPDTIALPSGYTPPCLAITQGYWKAWIMMLILGAHNPTTIGSHAWETYPTLRMLMEMCITNHFTYPPPTMQQNENTEEGKASEARLVQREKEIILELETHLAAASTKATITEINSLLLPMLTTMNPTGPARKPPPVILEQLAALNTSHRLGHLLCRSRYPDFLLDLIQRQGASQSMPWLADLVENSESSLGHLPVQCLCEFLLTSGPPDRQSKGQQLVGHLQQVLMSPVQDPTAPCEVLEYLLRRLGSPHMNSRSQAFKGLKLVLAVNENDPEVEPLPEYLTESAWLLRRLPLLPHFQIMRPHVVVSLRQACQVENDPSCIASYVHFLAEHSASDSLPALTGLVQDMAQLIVERSTIMNAIMPDGSRVAMRSDVLHSLMLIFKMYMAKARAPQGTRRLSQDGVEQVLVRWATGEEATFHILVVNAMIILLSNGPCRDSELYNNLLDVWFPLDVEPPKAYLIDTMEEAILIPDWLKLRMIRSGVERLVKEALCDLAVKQLILFIQSFGIPVSSMTLLLNAIDNADPQQIATATFDKHYMMQLVHVQRRRGAIGGQRFLNELRLSEPESMPRAFRGTLPKTKLQYNVKLPTQSNASQSPLAISMLFSTVFSLRESASSRRNAYEKLQKVFLVDFKSGFEKLQAVARIVQHLMAIVQSNESCSEFIRVLDKDPITSSLMLRLLWNLLQPLPQNIQSAFVSYMQQVRDRMQGENRTIYILLKQITGNNSSDIRANRNIAMHDLINELLSIEPGKNDQLIDRLVASNPELLGSATESQIRMLLFGKPVKGERNQGLVEACRPYLLSLSTHRASWGRLQDLVDHLLSAFETSYSPTPVLDFLEAMTSNPKLWQGREKYVPKHQVPEPVLNLTENQVFCLIQYIIAEAEMEADKNPTVINKDDSRPDFVNILESRLPLLSESFNQRFFSNTVKKLATLTDHSSPSRANVSKNLLILIHLHVPGLIQYLVGTEQEWLLKSAPISGWRSSTLDKISHTVLTALTSSNLDTKDWAKKSQDYELAARKMAVVHPSLVLRQLPLLAASLQGRVYMDYDLLRNRNHITVFSQVLGIIELLQPSVFSKDYAKPLYAILDSFMALLRAHSHRKDVLPICTRFIGFLQNYAVNEGSVASKYLQANSQALMGLQRVLPHMSSLRSLLSGILTLRDDGTDEGEVPQPSMVVSAPQENINQPSGPITAALTKGIGDDVLPALQELDHISSRTPVILEAVSEQISTLLMSPYSNIRTLAHTLLARLLKHNPQCNALTGYMRCLESGQGEIALSALEKLPEIVVCAQEHAVVLLEKAFSLGIHSSLSASTYISKAIALLNLQTGC